MWWTVWAACSSDGKDGVRDDATTEPETTGGETGTPTDGDRDGDGYPAGVDCDDTDAEVYPGAPERCGDGRLTNCDRDSEDGLVTVDGIDTFDGLTQALAAATSGSVVDVCAGTWTGGYTASVPVRLVGHGSVTLEGGAPALTVPGGSELEGLVLRNGRGGLVQSSPGTLVVTGCEISGNTARSGAGVSLGKRSIATFVGTTISDNVADELGGGIHAQEGSVVDLGDSEVTGNVAGVAGGGVALESADLIGGAVSDGDCPFPVVGDETTLVSGGGVALVGDCTVTDTEIAGNRGSGVSARDGVVAMSGVSVHDDWRDDAIPGGGIFGVDVALSLGDSVVEASSTPYAGGGVGLYGGSVTGGTIRGCTANYGAGLYLYDAAATDVVVEDNVGLAYSTGGGVYLADASTLTRATVRGNQAFDGGGVALARAGGTIVDTEISANTSQYSGGVLAYGWAESELVGTSIVDNVATLAGGGIGMQATSTLALTNCEVLRNTAPEGGGASLEGQSFTSSDTDWGAVGPDDNVPDDVSAGSASYGYGADATFTCAGGSCTP